LIICKYLQKKKHYGVILMPGKAVDVDNSAFAQWHSNRKTTWDISNIVRRAWTKRSVFYIPVFGDLIQCVFCIKTFSVILTA